MNIVISLLNGLFLFGFVGINLQFSVSSFKGTSEETSVASGGIIPPALKYIVIAIALIRMWYKLRSWLHRPTRLGMILAKGCMGLLCGSGAALAATAGVEKLTLVTVDNSTDTVVSEVIVTEAYRRLGIEILIKKYPGERALRLANHGEVDGEVQRIAAVKDKYRNLIQVLPPINYLEASVFSRSLNFEPTGWNSLRPYGIGLIRGIKFAENNTEGMNRHLVSDYLPLFKMLDKGRFDIVVTPRINGLFHITKAGFGNIRELRPPITHFDLFHYLHKNRADLVPQISAVLQTMQASGELEMIRRHVMSVLLDRARQRLPICDHANVCVELYAMDR